MLQVKCLAHQTAKIEKARQLGLTLIQKIEQK